MKRLTLSLALILSMTTSAFATLTNGSPVPMPNRNFPDINGNPWSVGTYTSAGKTVIMLIGQAWNTNTFAHVQHPSSLDSAWDQHGPTGTIDQNLIVVFIETDPVSGLPELNGGPGSAGNYVAGTNYFIVNLSPADAIWFDSAYSVSQFPTILALGPNNTTFDIGLPGHLNDIVTSVNNFPMTLDALPLSSPTFYCNTTFAPQFTLKNNNVSAPLTSCTATFQIDGGLPQNYNWTGNILAGGITIVTLPMQTIGNGNHTLSVVTSNPNGGMDNNTNNDTGTYTFCAYGLSAMAPYTQLFAGTGWPYANWALDNPGSGITWTHSTANGGSLKYDSYNNPFTGEQAGFTVEPLDLSAMTTPTLQFIVASKVYPTYSDALQVDVSTDCGATWTTEWYKAGATLATVPSDTSEFTPSSLAQWRAESVIMTSYAGNANVLVRFIVTNGFSNNVYVDDISVTQPLAIEHPAAIANESQITVFPNPATDATNVTFTLDAPAAVTINIYDAVGSLVSSTDNGMMSAGIQSVQCSTMNLTNGMYVIEVFMGEKRAMRRMYVAH